VYSSLVTACDSSLPAFLVMASISEQLSSYSQSTGPRAKGFRLSSTIDTSRLSQLGCGGRCCKLSLTAMACFLIVTGIAIAAGAGYANQNSDVLAAIGTSFANLVLAFGVVLMFVGSIGLGGAVRESRALLSLFMCILGCFMLAMLIFGAWALSNLGKEGVVLGRAWQAMGSDQKLHIEAAYGCCGAYYWGEATDVKKCPKICQTANNCPGCFPQMISDYRQLYTAFGVVFLIVSCIMIATIVSTFCLMSGIAKAAEAKSGGGKKKGGRR